MQLYKIVSIPAITLNWKMSFSDRAEADDGITVGQDDENKILNSVERLTLVDQSQCMGNQAVTI